MKYLVIGGAGFLGTKLTRELIQHQHSVTIYDNFLYSNRAVLPLEADVIEDCVSNIANYESKLRDFDSIFYLAGPRLNDITTQEQIDSELSNLSKVLELLNPNSKFYFTSSCSVYGKDGKLMNEDSPTQITSKYSELKIKSEELILEKDNPNHKIFRLATLYGDGFVSREDLMINSFLIDVLTKDEIILYDPDTYRPHLYLNDASILLTCLSERDFQHKILNIGTPDNTLSKLELANKLNELFNRECKIVKDIPEDSRNYKVEFEKLSEVHPHCFANLDESILETKSLLDRFTCSLEKFDNLSQYYLPNTASPSWYVNEEGRFGLPKSWGWWNIVDERYNLFPKEVTHSLVTPHNFKDTDVTYKTIEQTGNDPHLYVVHVFNGDYFKRNRNIGLNCVDPKYMEDLRAGRARLVFICTLEGYSGEDGNDDLEIIQDWIDHSAIRGDYVYYLSGNLIGHERVKQKNLSFNVIPVCMFDSWIGTEYIDLGPLPYEPIDAKHLYLSYARNPRDQRIALCGKLLEKRLLDKGRVSLARWDWNPTNDIGDIETLKRLHKMTPIEIDRTLEFNLADNIHLPDYKHTFVSIVNETLTNTGTLFLSEKIFKAIAVGHPFLVIGNVGTLEYLKSLGYKTFDKWFDESYDKEEYFMKRVDKVVDQVMKFKRTSKEDLIKIRKEMQEITVHNQKVFIDTLDSKYDLDRDTLYLKDSYRPITDALRHIWKTL